MPSLQDYQTVNTKQELSLPDDVSGEFKTYMSYQAITNKESDQYVLQQQAVTVNGFRMVDDRYLIAVGTHYAKQCGIKLDVTLDDGSVVKCIVGDIKQDIHTDSNNQYVIHNGNIVEFIVDVKSLNDKARLTGDVSYAGMDGEIIKIERIFEDV